MRVIDKDSLLESLRSCFISRQSDFDSPILPALLVNDPFTGRKILTALEEELSTCDAFDFSIAFINDSGLASIMHRLEYLSRHNIRGRILTTNYLNFTSPGSLSKLLEFPNIEVRAYTKGGFHPKGYIFRQSNYYSIIIGSANLTSSALSQNQEWSIRFLSCTDGQIVYSVRDEFERIWNNAETVTPEWIQNYSIDYNLKKIKLQGISKEVIKEITFEHEIETAKIEAQAEDEFEIVPNAMQKEAMAALAKLREENESRALLIAATGTGKTYLSIFDVKQCAAKRILYVAHRDMILTKSENSFRMLLPGIKTGFLNGTQKDINADSLFASVFTLAKSTVLEQFKKNHFDYIIIDEVHHAGAASYQKIIDYFEPLFLLGLTATPERTDGFDIFSMFHNNIAYEIRLQKALEENLLCPFHYYGISDLTVNGETIDDKSDFSKLVSEERIIHIEKTMRLYKSNSYPVKGLVFCSRTEEARMLSDKLNSDGFYTRCLTGENSDEEREAVIKKLESNNDPLQYIISVDIFNEGVDIPCINQIIMLRPTQSAVIFVQQLGRGLRKDKSKEYVSVIDFIGNYENNFFIPIALFGDNSYDKDTIRRVLSKGSGGISGSSTIQIDEIAKTRIFEAINQVSFTQLKLLKGEYIKLKMRIARIPTMVDFIENGFIDPLLFIDYAGSYYNFKQKVEKDYPLISPAHRCALQFISCEFARGIRVHELMVLKLLLDKNAVSLEQFKAGLSYYNIKFRKKDIQGTANILSPAFYTENDRKKYGNINFIEYDEVAETIKRSGDFNSLLEDEVFKMELKDCLEYGLRRAAIKKGEIQEDNNFVLYRKYTRKDVCKLLNWKSDCSSTIYGYKTETSYDEYTCPVFVTYNKKDDISDSTKYDDIFIDNTRFSWMSRSRRTSDSLEVANIIRQPDNKIKVMLFVKKNDDEGSSFYYLGNMKVDHYKDTTMKDSSGNDVSVVNILFDMLKPVPWNLYNYLTS